ncbi:hypothetical protein MMC07_001503 [Pseudocyphellaria aurata]|nr:hypothetical protein [Pseudocyphellaria aurata]
MVAAKETDVYRTDSKLRGTLLNPTQRENLIKPYLPSPPTTSRSSPQSPWRIRALIKQQVHFLVFTIIHTLFSLYIRLRQTYHALIDRVFTILYYHHRAPELIQQDVRGLTRIPEHLSVILELKGEERGSTGLERLIDEVAEISAWCACVGIPMLSVFESTGILKKYLSTTHRTVSSKLHAYFGRRIPALQTRAPHGPALLNGGGVENAGSCLGQDHISILLLSSEDGRSTLVDLTKTLAEMSQRHKLSPDDISRELIDAEITESVMGEPDLLVLFGPNVGLQGYPPWQVRLTEIFHVQDNSGVGYQVFLRALHRYAKAQMRFGR